MPDPDASGEGPVTDGAADGPRDQAAEDATDVTDGAGREDPEELDRRVRALDRRVRRQKLQVERLNPIEAPERYAEAFESLVALEADLRELKAVSAAATERD